jgi:hypothetical protein
MVKLVVFFLLFMISAQAKVLKLCSPENNLFKYVAQKYLNYTEAEIQQLKFELIKLNYINSIDDFVEFNQPLFFPEKNKQSPFIIFPIEQRQIQTSWYYWKNGDKLVSILRNHYELPKNYVYHNSGYVNNLMRWNPQISNWNNVREKTKLYMEIPKLHPFNCYQKNINVSNIKHIPIIPPAPKRKIASIAKTEKKITKKEESNQSSSNKKVSFFTAVSSGSLNYVNEDDTVDMSMNSPLTIGLSFTQTANYSSSFYISRYTDYTFATETRKIPNEVGFNFYKEHQLTSINFYWGYDYEQFSILNVNNLENGISFLAQNLHYATVGLSTLYKIANQPVFNKFSLSQTFFSEGEQESLVGQKAIFFLATPLTPAVSLTLMYKKHILSDINQINIDRYGIGLSFNL